MKPAPLRQSDGRDIPRPSSRHASIRSWNADRGACDGLLRICYCLLPITAMGQHMQLRGDRVERRLLGCGQLKSEQLFEGSRLGVHQDSGPAQLADLLEELRDAGLTGFRLRPAALPYDLEQITRHLVPELQRRGAFRTAYEASTLRGLLGLTRPANRYAAA